MDLTVRNYTDRKEIINLLCILFILGSSFLSYIIPSLTSQMFSIGLTLFGYICFIFTNWTSLKRFYLYHKSIKYFVLYVLSNLIISTFFVQGWDNWGLYFTHTSILFLPIWSYLVQSKQKGKYFSIILITILLLSLFKYPLNPQLHSRSATYIKRNGLLIRKITIKSSRPFQCAYHPLTP